jgi:hypothetical protein
LGWTSVRCYGWLSGDERSRSDQGADRVLKKEYIEFISPET